MKIDLSNPFKTLFWVWAAACIVILPLLSMHAGITEDEPQHITYGRHVLDWYRGVDSTAVMSPFDNGVWKLATEGASSKTAINIYGGFVDGSSELIYSPIFRPLRIKTYHLIGVRRSIVYHYRPYLPNCNR